MRVRSFWVALGLTFSHLCCAENDVYVNLEQLNQQVKEYLLAHYQDSMTSAVEVKVGRLDPRLRLANCDQQLDFTVRDTGSSGGNVSVHTRCSGNQPWAVYISAEVEVMDSIVIASRTIPKGAILSLSDFDTQLRDTAKIANGYIIDSSHLIGKAATRTIRVGEALRYSLVTEPIAVKRGDTVVIEASTGAITVSSQGVALTDGRVGEQINVRNSQSERVVRVEILGPGRAKVLL